MILGGMTMDDIAKEFIRNGRIIMTDEFTTANGVETIRLLRYKENLLYLKMKNGKTIHIYNVE